VQITAADFGTQEMRLDGVDADAAERTMLRPAGRIEGRLIGADTANIRGVRMLVWTLGDQQPIRVAETNGTALVTTDAAGRFVIPAIATGPAQILFLDPPAIRGCCLAFRPDWRSGTGKLSTSICGWNGRWWFKA
jgi:hypothetical protein